METLKAPDTARGDVTRIGKSIVIKGELSCSVVGDITTQRISIEEGAHLKGSVNIQKEAPKKEVPGRIALPRSEAAQPEKR
jgi:cytoskeletal protein CcmA (bactofilin family)